ncbi:class F sortase [Trujillonella endophytica]|uniref:Sortase family protein n=1 Tax=Trujillonella endophytica TaxID=673521 RepID=A0A1H8WQV3_9ACTN|nr:class F sortase [Trujillella endophytica]SEP29883.1 Sortase family protein [Trujillella endophytica]
MRRAAAGAALGLALAIGVPVTWQLTREPASAGASVEQALSASIPSAPAEPPPPAPTASGPLPEPTVRDAAPAPGATAPAPVRLAVPALDVDAPLDPVGVAADGQMELPEDVSRVGWYRFGAVPGAPGSAVVAGHVDDAEQGLGALSRLREAAPGDEVLVTDATGAVTRWRVVARELITKQELPLAELFARAGPARLVLVTCGGPFLPEYRSYRDNVVVVAEPVR